MNINDDMIECGADESIKDRSGCKGWYHLKCVSLNNLSMDQVNEMNWKCDDCRFENAECSCFVCGKKGDILRCSRCKKAFYCSWEHQITDWLRHCNNWTIP